MDNKEYIINYPSVYMHTAPDITSEVSDELLYGTTLKKIAMYGDYFRCETSYGYGGYVHEKYLCEENQPDGAKPYIVTSPFCDLLTEGAYKYRPVTTLPRGSILYSRHCLSRADRFFSVIYKKHKCYVPASGIRLYEKNDGAIIDKNSDIRRKICDSALFYLGTPYRWGGKSPSGIDCSGLCFMAYYLNGIPLWRDSYADTRYVHEINSERALQGDLIYFKGHMALYIGDGEYVHSSASAGCVTVNSLRKNSIIYREDLAEKLICFARSNAL